MTKDLKVAICGGTHGNEYTGIYLLKHWQQQPEELERHGLSVETLLANESAYEKNRRYLEQDLNRRFASIDLENPELASVEAVRAKEINQILGPKSDPRVDYIIDLHTTTANMGVSVIINSQDPVIVKAAFYIHQALPDVTLFYQDSNRETDNFLMSIAGKGGILIEVGPCPQGLLRAKAFEQTRLAVMKILDFLELHQKDQEPVVPEQLPGFQFLHKIKFPEDDQGNLQGMIHPDLQDRDYLPIQPGDPLFMLFNGDTIPYDGEPGLVPAFINEAAYYDQHHALSFLKPITLTLKI